MFWHNKLPHPVATSPRPQQSQPSSPYIGNLPHSPTTQRAITSSTGLVQHTQPSTTPQAAFLPFGGTSSANIPSPEQQPPPAVTQQSPLPVEQQPSLSNSHSLTSPPTAVDQQPPVRDTQPVPFANLSEASTSEPQGIQNDNVTQYGPLLSFFIKIKVNKKIKNKTHIIIGTKSSHQMLVLNPELRVRTQLQKIGTTECYNTIPLYHKLIKHLKVRLNKEE